MESRLSDEELWSLVDLGGAGVEAHLAAHPADRARIEDLRGAIGMIATVVGAAEQSPPQRIGNYRVEREIGRGGGGVVYEAWQEDPPRRVALKVLHDGSRADPNALARLRREAEALGRLSHPHVATIHEAGRTAEGHPFLAMELVHGPTLGAHVKRKDVGLRERVQLFRDVCEAVHHAHRQGVIHRDVKTSNVLVDDEHGVKVVDFGLARLRAGAGSNVTENGVVLGTLGYMSPEQAAGEPVDERTDVYSLGVVLYELVTGALPFELEGKSALGVVRAIAETRPVAPRTRAPDVDRDLETIVLKALEKEPEQRYGSAAALAEDVGCWLAGRPILARRPTLGYRLRKLAGRNRFATAMLAFLLLFAVVATYSSTFHPHFLRLSGDWYATASPFDGLRWVGDKPQVQLGTTWYDLVSVDGFDAEYITGFCKQDARNMWRKRFSEDLLQVLNLMGDWPIRSVDLVLRETDSGRVVEAPGVALDHNKRQALLRDRNAWPVQPQSSGLANVLYQGRVFEVVAIDGVRADSLPPDKHKGLSYDAYCEAAGRSPSPTMRLELRDVATGLVEVFDDVPRERKRPAVVVGR